MRLWASSVLAQDVRLLGREAQPRPKEGRSHFVRVQAIPSAKSCLRVVLWGIGRLLRLAVRRFCPGFLHSSLKLAALSKVHSSSPLTRPFPSLNMGAWSKTLQSWRSRQPSQGQGVARVRSSGTYAAHPSFPGVRLFGPTPESAIPILHSPSTLLRGTRRAILLVTPVE